MDLSTIVGLALGTGLVIYGMLGGGAGLMIFVDIPSFAMVVGGSLAAMMVSNPLSRITSITKIANKVLKLPTIEIDQIITTMVQFSEKARREGLLALEDDMEAIEDEFMKKGMQLVVDGTDPEIIKDMLFNELSQQQERHQAGIKFFGDWASLAPGFGMIGTLCGLVAMLAKLDDASSVGAGMAIALITTLYGSVFANLVLTPYKNKLEDRDKDETIVQEIIIEGILSIQAGDNPKILETKLLAFLPPQQRETVATSS